MPGRIRSAEVERPEVDGLVRLVVLPVEGDAEEALLEDVAAADVQLDRALSEIAAIDPGQTDCAFSLRCTPSGLP